MPLLMLCFATTVAVVAFTCTCFITTTTTTLACSPCNATRVVIATQALLKCGCVHTGVASAYCSVAMVKTDAKLDPVSRKGEVRGYWLYLGSCHANVALERLARKSPWLMLARSNII